MDKFNFAWLGPLLWALLGLLAVLVWRRHRQHPYLLWLTAAWLCAGVASTAACWMGPRGVQQVSIGLFAWLAAVLTAQATVMRFGRRLRMSTVAAITGIALVAGVYLAYQQPAAQALQKWWAFSVAVLLGHVLLTMWRLALRHGMERNLLLIYSAVCVLIAASPWLSADSLPVPHMLLLPLCAAVFTAAMVACVWAESPCHLRAEHDRDVLTGLLSRQAFEKACGQRPAEQQIRFMVLCDLDHFQRVNQQFGKKVGDEVLRHFAQLLQTSVRTGDVVARVGGEEFVLALRHIDQAHAQALVQRIVDAMAQQHWASKLSIGPLTASFGVAMVREEDSLDLALHRADVLLCQAKDAGCHRIAMQDMVVDADFRFQ